MGGRPKGTGLQELHQKCATLRAHVGDQRQEYLRTVAANQGRTTRELAALLRMLPLTLEPILKKERMVVKDADGRWWLRGASRK